MGISIKHEKVKLIIGLIAGEGLFDKVKKKLSSKFGKIDFESKILDFTYTDYYNREMGADLKRQFLSFKRLIPPEMIADIKNHTNALESNFFSSNNKRTVNIDPGYLSLSKLVLATTKDHQHRIYLDKGIYAEVTLRYRKKTFCAWEWTYPDYCSKEYIAIFNHLRKELYKAKES
ncbi:MAG: DUF4416 family protein [Candidatus Omnitrophica bacterium]|nr:DUF4416 family protein [Candidatus Omnitrophota bacterium]